MAGIAALFSSVEAHATLVDPGAATQSAPTAPVGLPFEYAYDTNVHGQQDRFSGVGYLNVDVLVNGSLQRADRYCSAQLINPSWVLTLGTCLSANVMGNATPLFQTLPITSGTFNINRVNALGLPIPLAAPFSAQGFYVHPQFVNTNNPDDQGAFYGANVGLIHLDNPVFNTPIYPIGRFGDFWSGEMDVREAQTAAALGLGPGCTPGTFRTIIVPAGDVYFSRDVCMSSYAIPDPMSGQGAGISLGGFGRPAIYQGASPPGPYEGRPFYSTEPLSLGALIDYQTGVNFVPNRTAYWTGRGLNSLDIIRDAGNGLYVGFYDFDPSGCPPFTGSIPRELTPEQLRCLFFHGHANSSFPNPNGTRFGNEEAANTPGGDEGSAWFYVDADETYPNVPGPFAGLPAIIGLFGGIYGGAVRNYSYPSYVTTYYGPLVGTPAVFDWIQSTLASFGDTVRVKWLGDVYQYSGGNSSVTHLTYSAEGPVGAGMRLCPYGSTGPAIYGCYIQLYDPRYTSTEQQHANPLNLGLPAAYCPPNSGNCAHFGYQKSFVLLSDPTIPSLTLVDGGIGTLVASTGPSAVEIAGTIDEEALGSVLVKLGGYTLALSGENSYSGGTEIHGGVVQISKDSNLGSSMGKVWLDGGALQTLATFSTSRDLGLFGSGGTLEVAGNTTLFYNGVISGGGLFSKAGGGTLALGGLNTYAYGTIIYEGRLVASGGFAIPDSSAMQVQAGAVFQLADSEVINNIQGQGNVELGSNTLTIRNLIPGFSPLQGIISGSGGVTIDSVAGVVWFANDHTYTGLTKVNSGSLLVLGGINLPAAVGSISGDASVDGLLWFYRSQNLTYSHLLSGSGYVRQLGDSVLTLTGANTVVNIAVGGRNSVSNTYSTNSTLAIAGAGKLGASDVNVSVERGGHLDLGRTTQSAGMAVVFEGGTIANGSLGATFFNFFDGSVSANLIGTGHLQKNGAGTVFLSGLNTYSGITEVMEGLLNANGGRAIGDLSAVSVALGAVLALDNSETIGSLAGLGVVQLAAGKTLITGNNGTNTSFWGSISGDGGVTKVGLGTFTLGGFNSFTGPVAITAGTLLAQNGGAIGDSVAVNVSSGASFALASSEAIGSLSGAGALNLSSNTLFTGGNNSSTQWSGTTAGSGNLVKLGGGLFKTGNLGHTGSTQVNAGELNTNGAIAGQLFVAGGALFSGNASVAGAVVNNGAISPGNSFGTQSYLGSYAGGGAAKFNMEVWLDNPRDWINGETHDFVSIGGAATGQTLLNIVTTTLPSKAAKGPPETPPGQSKKLGAELVRVGGNVAANAFALAAPVIDRGKQFLLNYVKDYAGTTDGFFLKSYPRNEVLANAAVVSSGQAITSACFHEDVQSFANPEDDLGLRAGFSNDVLRSSIDEGTRSHQNYNCSTSTVGLVAFDDVSLGVRSGTGSTSGDIALPTGTRQLDGTVTAYEAIASFEKASFVLNISAGYLSGEWTVAGAFARTEGTIAAAQLGRRYDFEPFALTTLVGMSFSSNHCTEACVMAEIAEETGLLQGEASIRAEAHLWDGSLRPYLQASYSDGLSGHNWVTLEDAAVDASANQNRLSFDAGLNSAVGDLGLFANVRFDRDTSEIATQEFAATVGATANW